MVTVDSLAAKYAVLVGENYSDLDVSESFRSWVAQGLEELLADEWPFRSVLGAVTTIATQAVYSSPQSVWDIEWVSKAGEAPLRQVSRADLISRGYDLTEGGSVTCWYPAGIDSSDDMLIGLWPVPSTADLSYQVLGGVVETILPDSTDEYMIPPDMQRLIGYLVNEAYYENTADVQRAAGFRGRYIRALSVARKRHMAPANKSRQIARVNLSGRRGSSFLRLPGDYQ